MIYLNEQFKEDWKGKDPFTEIEKFDGKVFRSVKMRKTLQFSKFDKSFFIKIHRGVGWREIFKNFAMLKKPVLGARNEWEAIEKLKELGVDTMKAVAYGEIGKNPAFIYSFIITDDLIDTESLEDFCRDWAMKPPSLELKNALIDKLAWVSRQLHTNGINHRDYYICHFLLDISKGRENVDPKHIKASLIDLHRAEIRTKTPRRWIIKDVAGLWFSAMDLGLRKRDLYRFMKIYSNKSLKEIFRTEKKFWLDVNKTAHKLYQKDLRRRQRDNS